MILIPEIETVVILIPRTGTSSLRRAIAAKYPSSMLIYRHMEADGVPLGYDRWQKVTLIRDPLERMWSLYKFIREFPYGKHDHSFVMRLRQSASIPFCDWLVTNEIPFSTPYDSAGTGRYWPMFTCRHPIPENRKSQIIYARPDLGTICYSYKQIDKYLNRLGMSDLGSERHNSTVGDIPTLNDAAISHLNTWFRWDLEMSQRPTNTPRMSSR